jgi:hypothetical protein
MLDLHSKSPLDLVDFELQSLYKLLTLAVSACLMTTSFCLYVHCTLVQGNYCLYVHCTVAITFFYMLPSQDSIRRKIRLQRLMSLSKNIDL